MALRSLSLSGWTSLLHPSSPRVSVWSRALAALWWLCAAVPVDASAEKISGQLSVRDTLAAPGKQARIEVILVRAGLGRPGLGGEPVDVQVEGDKPGRTITGGDGRVLFDTTCKMRSIYKVTATIADSPRVESQEAAGILACWERRRPILLVDLAALADIPKAQFGLPQALPLPTAGVAPEPMVEAAEELRRLTDYFYNVIYLAWPAASGWPRDIEPRAWLAQGKFPTGPLLSADPGAAGLSLFLDRLKAQGWDNVKVGIGRTREFAEVVGAHRIEAVILPAESKDEAVPKKVHLIKDWREIRKKLRS